MTLNLLHLVQWLVDEFINNIDLLHIYMCIRGDIQMMLGKCSKIHKSIASSKNSYACTIPYKGAQTFIKSKWYTIIDNIPSSARYRTSKFALVKWQ